MWAFGTSAYGLGLTAAALWGLSSAEFEALKRQWRQAQEFQVQCISALRADMYNTSAKGYQRTFEAADFMGGPQTGLEERIAQLVADGYTPSEAAALATSRQTNEHKLFVIDQAISGARGRKGERGAVNG